MQAVHGLYGQPANEYVVIPAVEQEPLRSSREIKREFGLSQHRVIQELHDDTRS
jgi:hypothetical protein